MLQNFANLQMFCISRNQMFKLKAKALDFTWRNIIDWLLSKDPKRIDIFVDNHFMANKMLQIYDRLHMPLGIMSSLLL